MTKLNEYVQNNNFGGASALPDGKTKLVLADIEVEETSFTDDKGKTINKWILKVGEEQYRVGVKVMEGIKECESKGATSVIVMKKGEGMNTNYMVVDANDVLQ